MSAPSLKRDVFTCGNCGAVYYYEGEFVPLEDIEGLAARLDPGGIVPHGECTTCGAFVYKSDEEVRP